jgi:hypothetical protein
MPRSALFVVDIQDELGGDPATRVPHSDRIRQAGTELLGKARKAVDHARQQSKEPDLTLIFVQHEELPPDTLVKGTKAWELLFPPKADDENELLVAKTTR